MTDPAMFSPLRDDELEFADEPATTKTKSRTPIIPVPADAPPCRFRHPVYGESSVKWPYHDAEGGLVAYAVRFNFMTNGKPDKDVLPVTFCEVKDRRGTYRAWRSCGVPEPRPLYRLPQLLADPASPVVFTEGEKKADRAPELFAGYVSTTTMGGSRASSKSDFSPMKGRSVTIWSDHDDAGQNYAKEVAELLLEAGASKVSIVNVPDSFPEKWDLANELPPGVSIEDLRALLANATPYRRPENSAEQFQGVSFDSYRSTERGLHFDDPDSETDTKSNPLLLCGPIEVVAETRDDLGDSWGILLRWRDHDGRSHEFALPRASLAGDGTDARRLLMDGGLYVAPGRKARERLTAYLASVRTKARARGAL